MLDNMPNNTKLIILFLGIMLFAGVVESPPALILILIVGGMMFYANDGEFPDFLRGDNEDAYESHEGRRQSDDRRSIPRSANADTVHEHALTAVQRAGHNPDRLSVLPVDIGLLAFKDDHDPVLHRTWPVEDDNDYVQPFVQLRVPQVAIGSIRFEVVDRYGQPVFVHEERYKLERGRNLVIPSTRLPLHDEQLMDGTWQLRVFADDRLIADHAFSWETGENVSVRSHIGEDGEINSELRAVLAANRLERMSLDDLLGDQEDDMPDTRQRRQ